MAFEVSGTVFFKLPLGHPTGTADTLEPLIAQPSGGAAVTRIVDPERFVAMGGEQGNVPGFFYGLDAVQSAFAGRPDLDLVNETEKFHPLAVISLGRLFAAQDTPL